MVIKMRTLIIFLEEGGFINGEKPGGVFWSASNVLFLDLCDGKKRCSPCDNSLSL